jgi:diguanylate cyclase (GGDEF)-like protein
VTVRACLLPDRAAFTRRVESALARGARVTVLLIDVDGFRDVNAALGRAAGDELLDQLAPRLRAAARECDAIAHLPIDGFAVLCEGLAGSWDAVEVARRLATAWREPFVLGGEEIFATASTGIAMGGSDAAELLRHAESALHRAQERGRGEVELYDDVLRARAHERLRIATDLRRALAGGEIGVVYQPIVDLRTGRPRALEALARWTHPERGAVSPAVFVAVAERTGLIGELGRRVLHTACRQLAEWRAEIPGADELWVSVNVSPHQIAGGELPGDVKDALQASGLPPRALALEVIESALMEESDAPGPVLALLRALGVRVVLDDFGTGYSSLSYLRTFPIDGIKLDRSFIDGLAQPDAAAVVEAVIGMAAKLGLVLTAEGVETREHAERLRVLGCPLGQGYVLARPLPAGEAGALLAAAATRPAPPRRRRPEARSTRQVTIRPIVPGASPEA